MAGICTLRLDKITCPYYKNERCIAEKTSCCFWTDEKQDNECSEKRKKEKWFERYL